VAEKIKKWRKIQKRRKERWKERRKKLRAAEKRRKSGGKIILELILEKGSIDRSQIEKVLNIKQTRAREILGEMVKNNLIIKEGKGRSTHYKLK